MEFTPVAPIVSVLDGSLAAAFADVPDPRRAASVVSPLPAVLALVVAALLAGQVSVLAIAQWAARQEGAQLVAFGFPPGRTPCQTTLHRLLQQLDGRPLAVLQQVSFVSTTPPPAADAAQPSPVLQGVAIDGKGQRGRLHRSGASYATHALAALEHTTGRVLAHAPLGPRPELPVKGNQPRLQAFVQSHFTETPPQGVRQSAWTEEAGHGRTHDRREVTLRPIPANPLAWPGLAQVFRQVRTWEAQGQVHHSVHYGITSLTPSQASAAQVLALRRGHWSIENVLHRQKDVLFREDASQVHLGSGPAVLSLLRDAAITLLHRDGHRDLAARTRALSQVPHRALALVCHSLPTRA